MCFISANGSIRMQFENIPIKLPIYYCKWPFLNPVLSDVPCTSSSFTNIYVICTAVFVFPVIS